MQPVGQSAPALHRHGGWRIRRGRRVGLQGAAGAASPMRSLVRALAGQVHGSLALEMPG